MFSIATKASFKHVRWFITPDNILDVRPFKDFFIQTLAVNNNHNFSSQNKIFIVFGILANTLWSFTNML